MFDNIFIRVIKSIAKILLAFILGVVFLVILVTPGTSVFLSGFMYLLFGFINFFANVLPQVEFNVNLMIQASICFLGIMVGGHYFLKWLYCNRKPDDSPKVWRPKWTVSLIFAIVVVFASGIAAIGIIHQAAWLNEKKLTDQWPTSEGIRYLLRGVEHEIDSDTSVIELQQKLNEHATEWGGRYQLLCIPNRDTRKLKAIVVVPRFPREEFDVYTLPGDFGIDEKGLTSNSYFTNFRKVAEKQSYPVDQLEEIVIFLQSGKR